MASEQLDLSKLLEAIGRVLNAFNFPNGSAMIERVTANLGNNPNNTQLLANLKQELAQLPSLTTVDMSNEMRCFIQALIESVKAANTIDKRFVTRAVNKLYRGFEPFARNEGQHTALIDMQSAKEEALGIELRHRIAHKLRTGANEPTWWKEENDELQMTSELQAAPF